MRKTVLAIGLSVGLVALGVVKAQQARTGGSTSVMALTAMDYIQIKQLVNRYAFALDTGSRNGYDYADLFSPDGAFDSNSRGRYRDVTSWRPSPAVRRKARCTSTTTS